MERLLERFGQPDQDQVALWVALVDKLRPPRPTQTDTATEYLRTLSHLLARQIGRASCRERVSRTV